MIAATIFATLMRGLGPDLGDVHVELTAELPWRDACDAPLDAQAHDCPERARWALTAIADRECPGWHSDHFRWLGRHRKDSRFEPSLWRKGHRRGNAGRRVAALASWCPAHADPVGMSTVGPHGLMYTYNVHRLGVPGNCVPWWVFASAPVSGRAALHRYLELCRDDDRSSWCPSTSAILSARRRRIARNN